VSNFFLCSRVATRTYCAWFAERDTKRTILARRSTAPWSLLLGRRDFNQHVTDPEIRATPRQERVITEPEPNFFIFFSSSPKVPIQTRTVDEFGLLRAGRVCVSGGV
jgi:hypothetical protein